MPKIDMNLVRLSLDLAFLCPGKQNEKALAKSLYPQLVEYFEYLEKSYKLQDRYKFQSLNISIENKKGSVRYWHDPMKDEDGQTKMKYDYGYIRLTEGADGEHVDCYIGPDKEAGRVYVVHQKNPKNGEYDEDKVMLGFNSADEARQAYMDHYDDPKFFGSMEEYNFLTFKNKVFRKKGKITGDSLKKSKMSNFHLKLKEFFTSEYDGKDEFNIYRNHYKLKELKNFPDGLDLENCEIIALRDDIAYFEAGGDWQQGINFGVILKNGELVIVNLYEGDVAQNKKRLREALKELKYGELQKSKKFSAEDIKNKNMRWVTIRGNHVLLQGMEDGSYIVVGGAGGKLNHMRIDRILTTSQYKNRKKEKKEAQLVDLTKEEIHEQAEKRKEDIKQKKIAKQTYEMKVKDIMGLKDENIRSSISAKEMDELYSEAQKKIARQKKKDIQKLKQQDIEDEVEAQIQLKTEKQIKKTEKHALDVLASEFFGDEKKEEIKDDLDIDKAMDILKARKEFRASLKELNRPTKKKQLSFNDTYAGYERFTNEDVLKEVQAHIETQQNIQLYEIMDRQSEAIQKHINSGAAEALNGIVGDVYTSGASLSAETVDNLGMDACVQIIANQLYADGNAEKVKDALVKFVEKNNAKIIKKSLKEIEKRFHNADTIRSLSGKDDDPEAILSIASANGYALRQLTRGQHVLGTAVGSLRSAAHLINAIEEGVQDKVFIDMGNDLARARRKILKAGFRRGEYKIKSKAGGQKGFVVEIPKKSTEKFFEKSKQVNEEKIKIDRIKSHKENNGYIPKGMKEGIKLDPAQEAGLRFFKEKDNVLLDFSAGLGKTAIGYAAIMEAMENKGVKKALFVTPAKLRTQTSTQESKKFLDSYHQKLVRNTDEKSFEERKAIYQEDGIHFIGHDQLRTDIKELKSAGYDMIVVDEIHYMTNQRDTGESAVNDSGRYRGMMQLKNIPLKIGMSGTNIRSSKKELYKKINFIDPNHTLGTMKEFEGKYKGLNQGSNAFQDSSNDAFRKEIADYIYTQKNDLPVQNKQEEIRMPMTASQKKAYKESEKKYIEEKNSLNKKKTKGAGARRDSRNYDIIHDGLGQFENSKINTIIDTMEHIHPGEKAVIHCYRKKAIRTAVSKLEKKYGKGSVAVIDGDSKRGYVSKVKAAYNDPENKLKFVIGTKSVESGLNLQHGGRVTFHLDVPSDEAAKEQREARQYRRGQEMDTHSYLLVTETPFDINKVDQMERKGREMKILGNPMSVESKDESGFLSMLNQVEKEAIYG